VGSRMSVRSGQETHHSLVPRRFSTALSTVWKKGSGPQGFGAGTIEVDRSVPRGTRHPPPAFQFGRIVGYAEKSKAAVTSSNQSAGIPSFREQGKGQ
jgi:hypothetical protein